MTSKQRAAIFAGFNDAIAGTVAGPLPPRDQLEALRQSLNASQADNEMLRGKVAKLQHDLNAITAERDRIWEEYAKPLHEKFTRQLRLSQRSLEHIRLEKRLAANVSREIAAACEGRTLEKVNERHGTIEVRQVAITDECKLLRWWHPNEKGGLSAKGMLPGGGMLPGFSPGSKTLELQTVTRLKYGHETGLQAKFPEVLPWLCFSLDTAERSYDFICPDEYAAKCFVLALSRLCIDATGKIESRQHLLLRQAWSKVKKGCERKGLPLARAVLEAANLKESLRPKAPPSSANLTSTIVRQTEDDLLPSGNAGMLGIDMFLSATPTSLVSARARSWPKAGETWIFTGAVTEVEVYRDAWGKEWANQIKCFDKTIGRRAVTILSSTEGQCFVEIRGTDKLKFVKGFIRVQDANGTWLLEREQKQL